MEIDAPNYIDQGVIVVAKITPPASISIATIAGYQVSEVLIWATLIYTALLIGHKLYEIFKSITGRAGK